MGVVRELLSVCGSHTQWSSDKRCSLTQSSWGQLVAGSLGPWRLYSSLSPWKLAIVNQAIQPQRWVSMEALHCQLLQIKSIQVWNRKHLKGRTLSGRPLPLFLLSSYQRQNVVREELALLDLQSILWGPC